MTAPSKRKKLLVTTSAFTAGAVVDLNTKMVVEADHWLAHLRGLTEDEFRKHCIAHKWPVQEVP